MTACRRSGPAYQMLNVIKYLDSSVFEPILITIYDEEVSSILADYMPYVSAHYFVKTSKRQIIFGHDKALRRKLEELKPDIVHTVGVFPDYAVSRIGKYKQVHTLRNYVYADYPMKFGKLRGTILAKLQLYAAKRSNKTIVCSESLSKIYEEKLNMSFDFIRNGIDLDKYSVPNEQEKNIIRNKLNLPLNAFIFIYAGSFIKRKNVKFLLENYVKAFGTDKRTCLLLCGYGSDWDELKEKYSFNQAIDFRGDVNNISEFLKASDAYVSCSKSEGLPNGVLEAMAAGLPVVLSDIPQHKEIYEADNSVGYLYKQEDSADLISKLMLIYGGKTAAMGRKAYEVVQQKFNAQDMSCKYQKVYRDIL